MPAPATPQRPRTSTRQDNDVTPTKSGQIVNLSQALGQKNPPFSEKIRLWQTQGGGYVTDNPTIPPDSIIIFTGEPTALSGDPEKKQPEAVPTPTPKTEANNGKGDATPAQTQAKEEVAADTGAIGGARPPGHGTQARSPSPKKLRQNTLDDDVRQACAPTKRVVSDEHWRNERPPEEATSSVGRPSPRPRITGWVRPSARNAAKPKPVKVRSPTKLLFNDDRTKVVGIARAKELQALDSLDETQNQLEPMDDLSPGAENGKPKTPKPPEEKPKLATFDEIKAGGAKGGEDKVAQIKSWVDNSFDVQPPEDSPKRPKSRDKRLKPEDETAAPIKASGDKVASIKAWIDKSMDMQSPETTPKRPKSRDKKPPSQTAEDDTLDERKVPVDKLANIKAWVDKSLDVQPIDQEARRQKLIDRRSKHPSGGEGGPNSDRVVDEKAVNIKNWIERSFDIQPDDRRKRPEPRAKRPDRPKSSAGSPDQAQSVEGDELRHIKTRSELSRDPKSGDEQPRKRKSVSRARRESDEDYITPAASTPKTKTKPAGRSRAGSPVRDTPSRERKNQERSGPSSPLPDTEPETPRDRPKGRRKPARKSVLVENDDAADVAPKGKQGDPDTLSTGRSQKKRRSVPSAEDGGATSPSQTREQKSARRKSVRKFSYELEELDEANGDLDFVGPQTCPPRVYGSRVEAWLSGTPDPFVETEDQLSEKGKLSEDPKSTDSPPKSKRRQNAPSDEDEASYVSQRRRSKRRSRVRRNDAQSASDIVDEHSTIQQLSKDGLDQRPDDSRSPSSPPLPRHSARYGIHSTITDTIPEDDAVSSATSSVDASAFEVPDTPFRERQSSYPYPRRPPFTGRRLSTIASVDTFDTKVKATAPSVSEGSEITIRPGPGPPRPTASETNSAALVKSRSSRRRRLATHADLMSVLSMPKGSGSRSIISARSIRTNRSRLATATIGDLLDELSSDEEKYMRELRTLVDGVIPVLLTCVLSKSDSAIAAGLFDRNAPKDDPTVTKPIMEMGIALDRLKYLHKRIPKDDASVLLSWANTAQKAYAEYIKSWRLGFQDVVVNLAPASTDESDPPTKTVTSPEGGAWDNGLPMNEEGYLVNGDGERVDVAFLLKRPLVRLKYLAKTFKGINIIKPSETAEEMTDVYQTLVTSARKRNNQERARLEDEAAAAIDSTRARDLRSLAPLAGVLIAPKRCVRARDYFDMHLPHSSGQEVDCRVELLLRDEPLGKASGGDLLLCEVESTGRWLFFPPIQRCRVSARNGDAKGEIIIMIRGHHSDGQEWSEVMSLKTDDEEIGFEWVQMLGLTPIPHELPKSKSFAAKKTGTGSHGNLSKPPLGPDASLLEKSRSPSPQEIEVPIGEKASVLSKKWGPETPDRKRVSMSASPTTPTSRDYTKSKTASASPIISPPSARTAQRQAHGPEESPATENSQSTLRRAKAKRYRNAPRAAPPGQPSKAPESVESTPSPAQKPRRPLSEPPFSPTLSTISSSSKGYSVWFPPSEPEYSDESASDDELLSPPSQPKPPPHRRASSVPSLDLPTIQKVRKPSHSSELSTPIKEQPSAEDISTKRAPQETPLSAPEKFQKHAPEDEVSGVDEAQPPPPPPHRVPTPVHLQQTKTPQFTPQLPPWKTRRRSSSPLKHEYLPSTATESSLSEYSTSEDDVSSVSDSSQDLEDDEHPGPLLSETEPSRFPKNVSPPASVFAMPSNTISPSESASQSPYRTVPRNTSKASKAIASIFSWSDQGMWKSLHPEECSIVVTPGLIEAYEMSAEHSKPLTVNGDEIRPSNGEKPLVALELTPLVPLRRGTAVDISIRSPPTPNSRIRSSNNIMFRSRNPEECEQLYAMINTSRINNPTYLALQNARGPYGETSWASVMDRRNAARPTSGSSTSWWHFGGSIGRSRSYRASTSRAASTSAGTESSVGTMTTAFSALRRFSSSRIFNVQRSTVGSRTLSIGSAESNSADSGSGASSPAAASDPTRGPAGMPLAITNTKIRLYLRETQNRWRDMGSARLSIMHPDPVDNPTGMRKGSGGPGMRKPHIEKRIVIIGKTRSETLLDVTLSESCFERVARTGIAVSVWEDVVGPNGEIGTVAPPKGGVSSARAKVYMIQMKTERECAYSFSLLGKLRY